MIFRLICQTVGMQMVLIAASAQTKPGFVIYGKMAGLKNGTMVSLYTIPNGKSDTIGKCVAFNEAFTFRGRAPLEGALYHIGFDTSGKMYKDTVKGAIFLLLENKRVFVSGSMRDLSLQHIKTTGLEGQEYYKAIRLFQDSVLKVINKLEDNAQAGRYAREIGDQKMDSIHKAYMNIMQKWVKAHLNSLVSAWDVMFYFRDSVAIQQAIYDRMSPRIQNGKYGRALKELLRVEWTTGLGQTFPEFKFRSADGSILSLSDVTNKGKLTILDFWASWCQPCRASFPEMKLIFKQYHRDGLNILGYSIDKSKEDWEKAIVHDSLPWYNVREERELADSLYGVGGIPMIYILDSNGKIIAKGIQAEELNQKIAQLLGE